MKPNHYLVTLGCGIKRNVIAASAFDAIRTALSMLTLSEQRQIIVRNIRIKCTPVTNHKEATC